MAKNLNSYVKRSDKWSVEGGQKGTWGTLCRPREIKPKRKKSEKKNQLKYN